MPQSRVWALLRSDTRAWIGIAVVVLVTTAALLAPLLATHDPVAIDLGRALDRPSGAHWLGTDVQGRDVWSRLVYGARVSLAVGIISQGIAMLLGVTLGLVAGYYGRWVDELVMRLADVTLAFPTLLLLIAMVAALQPSMGVVFATIGIVGWAGMARLVRGQVLVVRQLEYVQASRALGAIDRRIMLRHVLPNVIAPVVIAGTLGVAGAIMAEAALSFLGLGVQPPTPSWGAMIADGRDLSQLRHAPWTSLFPGLAIGAAVLGFNLLGDALRDALDPRFQRTAMPAADVPEQEGRTANAPPLPQEPLAPQPHAPAPPASRRRPWRATTSTRCAARSSRGPCAASRSTSTTPPPARSRTAPSARSPTSRACAPSRGA
jgi:ABC-type dipeptide/oligopeptide/nickel transport system permease subunit